jgi:DNA repair protein RecN (Recombination protein N)
MLVSLVISNIVLIERISLDLSAGLCALTGETGAGKSILLDALGLALGGRADAGMIRSGANDASVSATFQLDPRHPAFEILATASISSDTQDPIILRRTIASDGRSRAFVNDQPVSVSLLRQLGSVLVEIHGQFETQGLLNPATHALLLDGYAGLDTDIPALWTAWQDAAHAVEEQQALIANANREEAYLREALSDLDALNPQAGEELHLIAMRERLMHRTRVLDGLNAAEQYLVTENDPVRKAASALQRISDKAGPQAAQAMAALDRAMAEIAEAQALIQSLSADLQEPSDDLESLDERLHLWRAQARKHQCTLDDLPNLRADMAQRLAAVEQGEDRLNELKNICDVARKTYLDAARVVHDKRIAAGQKLDRLMKAELVPLRLDKARFVTTIDELPSSDWGPQGISRVRFLVATNPNSEPGPLNKIASGGEMARFMLALKVIMAKTGAAPTLIFDEVDSGIGGAVADAVGERLARLGSTHQVLVVTHAPQVAARAAHHFIVRKQGKKTVRTDVVVLSEYRERREEIARMLAGATITDEARAAADKLLDTGT